MTSKDLWAKGLGKKDRMSKAIKKKGKTASVNQFVFDSRMKEVPLIVWDCVSYLEKNGGEDVLRCIKTLPSIRSDLYIQPSIKKVYFVSQARVARWIA